MISNFFISFIVLVIIDYVWIGILMKNFYLKELGSLARMEGGVFSAHIPAALIVYVLLSLALTLFVFPKATTLLPLFLWGVLLGVIVYGVYDFTNYATLSGWSWKFMAVDILWGGFVCGITVGITSLIKTLLA